MPNSLLWVCLVAIWLFVLVPMVVKSRPTVRKTSDAALSTRVLHRGGRTIAKTKRRMASGQHPHDADWEPPVREYRKVTKVASATSTATAVKDAEVKVDEHDDDIENDTVEAPEATKTPVMKKVAVEADSQAEVKTDDTDEDATDEVDADVKVEADEESDDVDVAAETDADADAEADDDEAVADADDDIAAELDDDDADIDDGESDDAELADAELDEDDLEDSELEDAEYDDDYEDNDYDDEAEYNDDLAEDAVDEEVAEETSARRAHRGGFDPEADRERSDKRYRFRQRVMAVLGGLALVGVLAGLMIGAAGWALAAVVIVALVGYMFFLRRAVRSEQLIRQQRMRRLARARREEEARREQPEIDVRDAVPARLRRPGAIVLEIDDEDPIFDHLPSYEHVARVDELDTVPSYRRVVGQ